MRITKTPTIFVSTYVFRCVLSFFDYEEKMSDY